LLARRGFNPELNAVGRPIEVPTIALALEGADDLPAQGYRLRVTADGVLIEGADPAGLFYGVGTLAQLLPLEVQREGASMPGLQIEDWPDFPNRGVMLDVSRDRVPTMATLYDLVDLLASWKINQLQLYMEHTFAYRGHEVVWANASPFTGEEILALDAYCAARYVELVPNQNSFGHMHRWLIHEDYRHLAECPDGCELWPGHSREPFSLCPGDPGSLALLADLYEQLLPHFGSQQFNVGLDETFDLGRGRSRAACETLGTERVYLDFLNRIHSLVSSHGRTMQFWGDIILHKPELIPELPQDAVALEWGYEADHPFADHCGQFADAGLAFYVCPGTSSWNTIGGRTSNAVENIRRAALHGRAAGATGLLNTDWGDSGHMQPLPVSYLGYQVGAAVGWRGDTDLSRGNVVRWLNRHAFRDRAGVLGGAFYDLGNVYRLLGPEPHNSSVLFHLLLRPDRDLGDLVEAGLSQEGLSRAIEALSDIRASLSRADQLRDDGELVLAEAAWAVDTLSWAAHLGRARLEAGAADSAGGLSDEMRGRLAEELGALAERHSGLWLQRSRPGGLSDSRGRLEQAWRSLTR
jgi:hypothetical protein